MKATSVLLQQHRHFEYLLTAMEHDPAAFVSLLEDIGHQLDAHLRIKQELFYPAVAAIDPALVLERYEEHAMCAMDLDALIATDPKTPEFGERVRALRTLLALHIEAEEEHLYPKVEAVIGRARLVELGAELSARFDELLRDAPDEQPAMPTQRNRTGTRLKDAATKARARAVDAA